MVFISPKYLSMGFLGDILFPDNPKRRERAQELYTEIKSYEQLFKENYSQ